MPWAVVFFHLGFFSNSVFFGCFPMSFRTSFLVMWRMPRILMRWLVCRLLKAILICPRIIESSGYNILFSSCFCPNVMIHKVSPQALIFSSLLALERLSTEVFKSDLLWRWGRNATVHTEVRGQLWSGSLFAPFCGCWPVSTEVQAFTAGISACWALSPSF